MAWRDLPLKWGRSNLPIAMAIEIDDYPATLYLKPKEEIGQKQWYCPFTLTTQFIECREM